MNRFQRNYYRNRPLPPKSTNVGGEFYSPVSPITDKSFSTSAKVTYNRSCYVCPELRDFAQSMELPFAESCKTSKEELTSTFKEDEQITEDLIPVTIARLRELRKLLGCDAPTVENYSQFTKNNTREPSTMETNDGIKQKKEEFNADEENTIHEHNLSKQDKALTSLRPSEVYISDIPTVHVIAEKFTKYKKDNIELRRLEEKIVCVEYNVYGSLEENAGPVQKMRAFFSIKPQIQKASNVNGKEKINLIPSEVKNDFNISNSDLKKLNDKEIEMIDAKISQHNTYLDDLRSIMKRKHVLDAKKNKRFDLRSMYEIARRNKMMLDEEDISGSNIFTKSELEDIKDLVLKKTDSNISGITRRTIPRNNGIVTIMEDDEATIKSQSFVKELFTLN